LLSPAAALAQSQAPDAGSAISPAVTAFLLAAMSLVLLLALMATAFVRIGTVLAILRLAVGLPSIPPASVVTGLTLVLTLFVMAPVGTEVADRAGPLLTSLEKKGPLSVEDLRASGRLAAEAGAPLLAFLKERADPVEVAFFHDAALRLRKGASAAVEKDSFQVLLPAFVIGELKQAFRIGFLLFIPFLVIDLVVANLLVAIGLTTLQPATVALPLKLLLFIMADGWHLVAGNLVKGFLPS